MFRVTWGQSLETLCLPGTYCIRYHEQFNSSGVSVEAYQCMLTLSDPTGWTIQADGPLRAYWPRPRVNMGLGDEQYGHRGRDGGGASCGFARDCLGIGFGAGVIEYRKTD